MPKETLYSQLHKRVDQMILDGLVDEVKALFPFKSQNALLTVGYREIFDFIEGKCNLEEAIEKLRLIRDIMLKDRWPGLQKTKKYSG